MGYIVPSKSQWENYIFVYVRKKFIYVFQQTQAVTYRPNNLEKVKYYMN